MKVYQIVKLCDSYECDECGIVQGVYATRELAQGVIDAHDQIVKQTQDLVKKTVSKGRRLIVKWAKTLPTWTFDVNTPRMEFIANLPKVQNLMDHIKTFSDGHYVDYFFTRHEGQASWCLKDHLDEAGEGLPGYLPAPELPERIILPETYHDHYVIVEHDVIDRPASPGSRGV